MDTSPTSDFYVTLQNIYHEFNKRLFNNELPNCIITMQRQKNVMGYFSAKRWSDENKKVTHEIALNPSYFATYSFYEVFQTIVHEMCHLWQFEFGKPSIRTYHNKEWGLKMKSIGLMPSSTGTVGGKKTGQSMNEYPIKNGKFEKVCIELYKKQLYIKWFDRVVYKEDIERNEYDKVEDTEEIDEIDTKENMNEKDKALNLLCSVVSDIIPDIIDNAASNAEAKKKVKYQCPKCKANVWGKNNLKIGCIKCGVVFNKMT